MANFNGTVRTTVLRGDMKNLRALALDPRCVFFTSRSLLRFDSAAS